MEFVVQMIYYMIALIDAFVLLRAYNRNSRLSRKLSRAMLMNFFMICFYSLNLSVSNIAIKSVGCSMAFIFTDLMLMFYFDFMLAYIGWQEKIPRTVVIFGAGYILLDSIFLLLNPNNELALSYVAKPFGDAFLLTYIPKVPFHFHTLFNSFIILSMILLLVLKCFEVPFVYFKRYVGPIFGMIMVVAIHLVYLSGILPFDVDPTPVLYVLVSLVLYFFTFDYLPSVTLGITRQMILQYLKDPIILFDYEGQLADHSSLMETLMPEISFASGNLTLDAFIKDANFPVMVNLDLNQEFDWVHEEEGRKRIYMCSYCVMKDEHEKLIGRLFVFHDVTDIRNTYFELENSMMLDTITGFYNKQSLYTQFPQWNNPEYWPVSVAVLNVDGMGALNEAYGTDFGDGVMRESARYIRRRVGNDVFCAKSDNGDIVVILERTSNADAGDMMEAVRSEVLEFYDNMPVSIEFGVATKEDRSISMEKTMQNARSSMQNKKMLKDKSASSSLVDSLKQTLCESDYQTEAHVERTRQMAARLGRRMGLEDAEIGKLELIAVLHDIGKVAIPQDIIKKQGKLTPEERKTIEQHTVKGYRIAMSSPELSLIADGILCHHEKWDGTGYPNGYAGEDIPLIARIISAVDSHDVMVNDRPYHKAMPERDAIIELRRCAGTQFDPNVVDIFTKLLEEEELPKEEGEGATMDNPPPGYVPRALPGQRPVDILPEETIIQDAIIKAQQERGELPFATEKSAEASPPAMEKIVSTAQKVEDSARNMEDAAKRMAAEVMSRESDYLKRGMKADGTPEGMRALIVAKLLGVQEDTEEEQSTEEEKELAKNVEASQSDVSTIPREIDLPKLDENAVLKEMQVALPSEATVHKESELERSEIQRQEFVPQIVETEKEVKEKPLLSTDDISRMLDEIDSAAVPPTLFRMRDDIVSRPVKPPGPPMPSGVTSTVENSTTLDGEAQDGGIKVSSLRIAQ